MMLTVLGQFAVTKQPVNLVKLMSTAFRKLQVMHHDLQKLKLVIRFDKYIFTQYVMWGFFTKSMAKMRQISSNSVNADNRRGTMLQSKRAKRSILETFSCRAWCKHQMCLSKEWLNTCYASPKLIVMWSLMTMAANSQPTQKNVNWIYWKDGFK